ncbi:tetratricopeptide repeat protein [Lysobacter sp. A286]
MYEPIIDALRRGDAAQALGAARDAVSEQPQDPAAHRLLASALRLAGDQAAAIESIDRAISLAPDDANLHLERAGLLLHERKLDEAQVALARSTGLDPNQFPAYIVQAQLAIGHGDLVEAARLTRTAARIAPEHPQVAALEGTLALRGGDPDRALTILNTAAQRWPEEPTLRHSLGFAYMAKGHYAFAEQAFASLRAANPDSMPLRALVADLLRRQGRPEAAADEIAPLLEGEHTSPSLQRMMGELELEANRNEAARDRLRGALQAQPGDRRTLLAISEAWRRLDAADEARSTLDALVAEHPQLVDLWRARLLFEQFASDDAVEVIRRWQQAMPDCIPAMEAQITVHDLAGHPDQGDALAQRITEIEPGHAKAEMRIINRLQQRDPEAAIERVEGLLARATNEVVKGNLRRLLGRTFDTAGQPDAAVATWAELHAEVVSKRLPLPTPSALDGPWPEAAELTPVQQAERPAFLLWGAPGSLIERVTGTLHLGGATLYGDRFGPNPPKDLFQRYLTIDALSTGTAEPANLIAEWKAALPARGIKPAEVFDWLLWWDNAAVLVLRPHLPEALLVIALRDPRDMLLDWLAFGSPAPFALESPLVAARWLAQVLTQVADLHEQDLLRHRLLRLDGIENDPAGVAAAIAEAIQVAVAPAPPGRLGEDRFPAGHWRDFGPSLADAYAVLTPVAVRLGYPEA